MLDAVVKAGLLEEQVDDPHQVWLPGLNHFALQGADLDPRAQASPSICSWKDLFTSRVARMSLEQQVLKSFDRLFILSFTFHQIFCLSFELLIFFHNLELLLLLIICCRHNFLQTL